MTRRKLELLLEEYGRLAVWTYAIIWLLVLTGFALAISFGFKPSGAQGGMGIIGAAWVATKLTQPFRIAGTLVLTPAVAAVLKKWRRDPTGPTAGAS